MFTARKKLADDTRFHSLRRTLSLSFTFLCLTMLLISSLLQVLFNFQKHQEALKGELQLIAKDAANIVGNFVEEKIKILDQAADLNSLISKSDRRELVLGKVMGRNPAFSKLSLLDVQGKEISNFSRLSTLAPNPITTEVKTGILKTVNEDKNFISQVYIDKMTSEPKIILAVPVKDSSSQIEGAFVAELNLKFMWDLVGSIKIGQKGVAYVVDSKGQLIAYKDISRILQGENLAKYEEVSQFLSGNNEEDEKEAVDISTGILGTRVISTYSRLAILDWAVVVERPVGEAFEPVIHQGIVTIVIVLIISVFVVASAMYLSNMITKPIVTLRDCAVKIGEGDLTVQISVTSHDEIGQLSHAFNNMTLKLRESYQHLEQKVQERTSELEDTKEKVEKNLQEVEKLNNLMVGREIRMAELKKEIEAQKIEIDTLKKESEKTNN